MFGFKFIDMKSIQSKVIIQIMGLVVAILSFTIVLIMFLVSKQLNEQTEKILKKEAHFIHEKIELSMKYLVENTERLTTNSLVVNALTDSSGRDKYLPALIESFSKGKDVETLNIVDYDGEAIFKKNTQNISYKNSPKLRNVLVLNTRTVYIDEKTHNLVVIAPIEYYSTTQGAIIVSFNINRIVKSNIAIDKDMYIKLLQNNIDIFSHNYNEGLNYKSYKHIENIKKHILKVLNTEVEVGILEEVYELPIRDTLIKLILLGIVFLILGIYVSIKISYSITKPILKLHDKVKASTANENILCAPLGTHDELDNLAEAFDQRTLLLQHQAEHDSLTGLPNRVLFMDRLNQAIKRANRLNKKLAVLFLDLDRFKEVNDSFGHNFGDKLLRLIGDNLEEVLRTSDTIARLGGDEFALLIDDIKDEESMLEILQKIMHTFSKPINIASHEFYVTLSIGISLYPQDGSYADELLKNSDIAMYRAKAEGRNGYQFYLNDMSENRQDRFNLETKLRNAISHNELEVYYQPQVDMRFNKIIGMEALIRWNHPELGLVPPDDFIPLAEEIGFVVEIDRFVIKATLAQYKKWEENGLNPGVLSINLSMLQLNRNDFINFVKDSISEIKMNPNNIMFEVTETHIMMNPEQSIITLNKLKELGVGLAIDDFGTGHSSLSYLKRLPIDKIKIDKSFVIDIPDDKDDMELTRAIIAMSHSLKRKVIAEGVETKEQSEFLQENACVEAQGYFYYKPQTTASTTILLGEFCE